MEDIFSMCSCLPFVQKGTSEENFQALVERGTVTF